MQPGEVGARSRLGEQLTPRMLTVEHGRDQLLDELRGAVGEERRHGEHHPDPGRRSERAGRPSNVANSTVRCRDHPRPHGSGSIGFDSPRVGEPLPPFPDRHLRIPVRGVHASSSIVASATGLSTLTAACAVPVERSGHGVPAVVAEGGGSRSGSHFPLDPRHASVQPLDLRAPEVDPNPLSGRVRSHRWRAGTQRSDRRLLHQLAGPGSSGRGMEPIRRPMVGAVLRRELQETPGSEGPMGSPPGLQPCLVGRASLRPVCDDEGAIRDGTTTDVQTNTRHDRR